MTEKTKPSPLELGGVQNTVTGGTINVTASEGGNVSANTLSACVVQGNVYMGSPTNSPEPAPDKGEFQNKLKASLQKKYKHVLEGASKQGRPHLLSDIYTDLDITVSDEKTLEPIKCTDIFKLKSDEEIRAVLTKGIAGTGKTVSVQKFILDWAEGKSNQDVDFLFPIPFRELSKKNKTTSLLKLFKEFFPEIHKTFLDPKCKTVIILDGLNDYRSSLDNKSESFCDIEQEASVNELLVNLLKGNLLDGALLWITSRPAAVSQLPRETFYVVTEVTGFNDQQKEEYFRKVHKEHGKAEEVITYMNKSSSLRALCDIPAFCRTLSIVLKDTKATFRNLTGLLGHYLCEHIRQVEDGEAGSKAVEKMILKLGKLAWELLEKNENEFNVKKMKASGIEPDEHAVFSGICVEINQSEIEVNSDDQKYRFFDRSFQEFLAAVYVILSFACHKKNPVQETTGMKKMAKPTLFDVHKSAVKMAIKNSKGKFDFFVKFLLGLSEETNHKFVQKFIDCIGKSQGTPIKWEQDVTKTVSHLSKNLTLKSTTPDRSSKLLEFLHELNDKSLKEKIKDFIHRNKSDDLNQDLILLLQTDEGIQEEFEMKSFKKSDTDVTKLIPVVKMTKQAKLNRCNLTPESCDKLARSLRNPHANVTRLELNENMLNDSQMKSLSSMLEANSKIEIISFVSCGLMADSCEILSSALKTETSHLRELDLSNNDLDDQGAFNLFLALADSKCKLETLRLISCQLTAKACEELSSSLKSPDSKLKHLDLSFNNLQDSGIQQLSAAGITKLQTLRLATCGLTEASGQYLGLLLQSQMLKELDLTNNSLKDSGVEQLFSTGLANPDCTLEKLMLKKCGITLQDQSCCKIVSTAIKTENCHLKELDLSYNRLQDTGAQTLISAAVNVPSKIEKLSLACCGLTDKTCEIICSELDKEHLETSCLQEIDLSDNDLKSAGLIRLCSVLKETVCKWRKLCLSLCSIEAEGFKQLANALRKNTSHMKHVDLRFNHPGENGEKMFQPLVEASNNALQETRMEHGGEFRLRKGEDRLLSHQVRFICTLYIRQNKEILVTVYLTDECMLTLDENTAHQRLFLTGKKIRWGEWEVPAQQLPDRFDGRTQVLCEEQLTGRCYWEVKWSGLVSIGVAYAGMARKGEGPDCTLGRNRQSWCLDCSDYKYTAYHNDIKTTVPLSPSGCHRVGVYLDSLDGILAFFKIKTEGKERKFTLLHHFKHDFSLPLYAGFRIWCDSSAFICSQIAEKKPA